MRKMLKITGKDLSAEFRKKGVVNTVLLFSVLVLLTIYFSIDHDPETLATFGPPGFWISLLFASFIGLNHFMQTERKNNCLLALRTSPTPAWKIFAGKSLSLFLMLLVVEVILIPFFLMIFEYGIFNSEYIVELSLFLLVVMLGNIGIALTGTLFSGLLISGRTSAFLLPIVLIPILLPLLIAGVRASTPLLSAVAEQFNRPGTPLSYARQWVLLLLGMDFLFVSAGSLLSDAVFSS